MMLFKLITDGAALQPRAELIGLDNAPYGLRAPEKGITRNSDRQVKLELLTELSLYLAARRNLAITWTL